MRASYSAWFLASVTLALAAVSAFNALADRYILTAPNGPSLETVAGFERVLKPVWLSSIHPDVILVGTSRVRDAFDPVLIARATGLRVFNYGVSSAAAYETRRFAQDAAAQPGVRVVVVSLDAFTGGTAAGGGSGFDETRLAVSASGDPTPRRDLWLFTTRFLSGGSLGMHAQGVYLLSQLGGGETAADRPDLFGAYARMTPAVLARDLMYRRARTMRMSESGHRQLRALLNALCPRDLDLILYFSPDRIEMQRQYLANDAKGLAAFKTAVANDARRHDAACRSRVSVFDFLLPSPLTTEPMPQGESASYVDLVHIRPPTGLRLLRTMLRRPGAEPGLGRELVSDMSRTAARTSK